MLLQELRYGADSFQQEVNYNRGVVSPQIVSAYINSKLLAFGSCLTLRPCGLQKKKKFLLCTSLATGNNPTQAAGVADTSTKETGAPHSQLLIDRAVPFLQKGHQ